VEGVASGVRVWCGGRGFSTSIRGTEMRIEIESRWRSRPKPGNSNGAIKNRVSCSRLLTLGWSRVSSEFKLHRINESAQKGTAEEQDNVLEQEQRGPETEQEDANADEQDGGCPSHGGEDAPLLGLLGLLNLELLPYLAYA
jgi:hypothetical protein